MITFLEGRIEEKTPTRTVLNVGGVGYEVFTSLNTFEALPALAETCRLLTFDYPREDQHLLFGFAQERERSTFLMLIGVNGIGPRLALTTLSGITVTDLCGAITAGDTRRLSSISGIGKRLAERMVVELRDRVEKLGIETMMSAKTPERATDRRAADASAALTALGYRASDAERMVAAALRTAAPDAPVEAIVRKALSG